MDFFGGKNEWFISDSSPTIVDDFSKLFDFSDIQYQEEEIRETIGLDVYLNTYISLTYIHKNIRKKFEYEYTMFCNIKNEIKCFERISKLQKTNYSERMNELVLQSNFFNTLSKWEIYKEKSIEILKEYVPLMPDKVKCIVSKKQYSKDQERELLNLILKYLDVVESTGLKLNIFYETEEKEACKICKLTYSVTSDDYCKCGNNIIREFDNEEEKVEEPETEKQTNTSSKPQIEWLNNLLGIGVYPDINEELFRELDDICIKNNLATSEDVRKNPEEGTIELLKTLMQKQGFKNYKHRNVLAREYWGWQLPTMTEEQKEEFKRNCIVTRKIYPLVSKKIPNINLDITGYLLLSFQGLEFDKKFFKFPRDPKIISNANKTWKKIIKKLKDTNKSCAKQDNLIFTGKIKTITDDSEDSDESESSVDSEDDNISDTYDLS